ncbi:MucBP domain-containing protein, partial [Streptococcus hyovaginalis]
MKKSFDWYKLNQKFSLRKYHFGVASVLLGTAAVLVVGGQTVKADENVVTEAPVEQVVPSEAPATEVVTAQEAPVAGPEAPAVEDATVSEATTTAVVEESVSPVDAVSTEEAAAQPSEGQVATEAQAPVVAETQAPVERTAQIPYRVVYNAIEEGKTFKPTQVQYAAVPTTDEVASTSITVSVGHIRTGYQLAPEQAETITQVITENQQNILSFAIVKKDEETVPAQVATTMLRAAEAGQQVTPNSVTVTLGGSDQNGQVLDDGDTISPNSILYYDLGMDFTDVPVNSGDYVTIAVPDEVVPVREVNDVPLDVLVDNVQVGVLKTVLGDNGQKIVQLEFTKDREALLNEFDVALKTVHLRLPVVVGPDWQTGETPDLSPTVNGDTTIPVDKQVTLFRPTSTDLSNFTRLEQVTRNNETGQYQYNLPYYSMLQKSEVAPISTENVGPVTVVYTISPEDQPFIQYNVDFIRNKGYAIALDEDRVGRTYVNVNNPNDGISVSVDDAGTTLTLTIDSLPAGKGIDGGSIPLILKDVAVDNQLEGPYHTDMKVFVDGQEVIADDTQAPFVFNSAGAESEPFGTVLVYYKDTDGNTLQPLKIDTPRSKEGTPYDTADDSKPTTITTEDGKVYTILLDLTKGVETGTVTKGQTVVTYIYKEVKSDVIVEYYDTEGSPISGKETNNLTSQVDTEGASVGTAYNTDEDYKPEIITTADGKLYRFKEVKADSAPTTGTVGKETTVVKYVYEEVKGNVLVNYVDTEGNPISGKETNNLTSQVDTEETSIGTSFDTTDNKPETITTQDGSKYVLVPSKTIGSETGKVVEGTTEVTYVYQKVANWIPQIPDVPETDWPKTSYPFDPTNPD